MAKLVEINGEPATVAALLPAMSSYGHFTVMQVRDGRVRGLDLHVRRLRESTQLLFGSALDVDAVLGFLRQAIAGQAACTVMVSVFSSSPNRGSTAPAPVDVMVVVSSAGEPATAPLRVRSVFHDRVAPEVKHSGAFGLTYLPREAMFAGYDDVLFVDKDGLITEASIWNVGFLDGDTVVWPSGRKLAGITFQLVQLGLERDGVRTETRDVRPSDVNAFDATFFMNSGTVCAPVISVDDVDLKFAAHTSALLTAAYETNPWEII
jgi:4-amino-4-deoxychorismate lyase